MDSYLRRDTRTQRNQAIHVLNAYAEAMNSGKDNKGNKSGGSNKGGSVNVPADDLFEMMGMTVKHAT